MAEALAEDGVDGLLCETFPHGEEALAAVRAATATGLSTWLALTPGPDGSLLTPADLAAIGVRARDLGAHHVLVNCVAASRALAYVQALVAAGLPAGAYGNAGQPDEATGWRSDPGEPERYAEQAAGWIAAGAEVVGGCCGTGPEHVAAIVFRERARKP
jgi:S-methylmethionine-dependent homocysteine/selenocysteine methylase